jgi:hypothetical protein
MDYGGIKPQNYTENNYANCGGLNIVSNLCITFVHALVNFMKILFDHAFYESENRKRKNKINPFIQRLEKIYWIKAALKDENAILKIKDGIIRVKPILKTEELQLSKAIMLVIIRFTGLLKAKFVTAFEKEDISNNCPDLILKGV